MRELLWRGVGVVVLGLFAAGACGGRSESRKSPSSTDDGAPECDGYATEYERCLNRLAPDPAIASKYASATRESLLAQAKDPASRDRVNEKCRAAREQLGTACR
jgi:hypothetical protein